MCYDNLAVMVCTVQLFQTQRLSQLVPRCHCVLLIVDNCSKTVNFLRPIGRDVLGEYRTTM